MNFNIGNLVSAAMGAVAKVANAVVSELSPVAKSGGFLGGIAEAAIGAAIAVANICEDGEIDEDEVEEILGDVVKVMVGATIAMFGSVSSDSNNDTGGERIVISGNNDGNHAARNFVETAIKQIKDWKSDGKENITWIVTNSGYTKKDIERMEEAAKENGANIIFIDNSDELYNYINTGKDVDGNEIEDRTINKITDVSFFSHGIKDDGGTLALDYDDKNGYANSNLNIDIEHIRNADINKDAFSTPHTFFGACNAGTIQDSTSFANEWVKKVGGEAEAICDPTPIKENDDDHSGQTSYAHINNDSESFLWQQVDRVERNFMGINFNEDGCDNYPTKGTDKINEDLYWTRITEDGSIEKIDQGGPRK